jgi:hypothetical protein
MGETAIEPKTKRRWYQYSLCKLLVMVALFAIVCSWYACEMRKAAKRRAAIVEVEKLHGWARYYDDDRPFLGGEPPSRFSWLRRFHGDEYLGRPITVSLRSTKVTNAGVAPLTILATLEGLEFGDTQITDAGVADLKGLESLLYLDLSETRVSDTGLLHLQGFPNLKSLDLTFTAVTDEGVRKLQESLPNCKIVR